MTGRDEVYRFLYTFLDSHGLDDMRSVYHLWGRCSNRYLGISILTFSTSDSVFLNFSTITFGSL
ncbi:MAG: hypothetical protein ACI8PB_000027 [Desulforhopalus sp.]|jgi:hypothetical protein